MPSLRPPPHCSTARLTDQLHFLAVFFSARVSRRTQGEPLIKKELYQRVKQATNKTSETRLRLLLPAAVQELFVVQQQARMAAAVPVHSNYGHIAEAPPSYLQQQQGQGVQLQPTAFCKGVRKLLL